MNFWLLPGEIGSLIWKSENKEGNWENAEQTDGMVDVLWFLQAQGALMDIHANMGSRGLNVHLENHLPLPWSHTQLKPSPLPTSPGNRSVDENSD